MYFFLTKLLFHELHMHSFYIWPYLLVFIMYYLIMPCFSITQKNLEKEQSGNLDSKTIIIRNQLIHLNHLYGFTWYRILFLLSSKS